MKLGMIFPGYSSQFVGMAKELYDESRLVQEYFEEASNCLNVNFVKLCFASSDNELAKMANAYTSIFLVSSSLYSLLAQDGITPAVVAGVDTGQYAALFAAQGISLPDGLYLLNKLALFYQEFLEGKQFAVIKVVGLDTKALSELVLEASDTDAQAAISLHESASVHYVSGDHAAIEELTDLCEGHGAQVTPQALEHGLHSSLAQPVVDALKMYLEKVDFKDLTIPLVNNVDALEIQSGAQVKAAVLDQITSAVQWEKTIHALKDCDLIIHIGPGDLLLQTVHYVYPQAQTISINNHKDIERLKELIAHHQQRSE